MEQQVVSSEDDVYTSHFNGFMEPSWYMHFIVLRIVVVCCLMNFSRHFKEKRIFQKKDL